MYPRCPNCGHVSRRWWHKLLPDGFTVCPSCESRLAPTLVSGQLLSSLLFVPFVWALIVVHWPAWQAFLLLFGLHLAVAPLRRFKVR